MNYKPYLLIITIFILIVHLKYQSKLENYAAADEDTPTHLLYASEGGTYSRPDLDNYILDNTTSSTTTNDNWQKNGFYHLYDKFGKLHFDNTVGIDAYADNVIPTLILESTAKCPILFSLFNSLERLDNKFTTNENTEGMDFRNKIQSMFFNINETVSMDFPIINLKSSLVSVSPSAGSTPIDYQPNFYFGIKNIVTNSDFTTNKTNFIKYIDNLPQSVAEPEIPQHYQFNHKQATFGVQEDYSMPDILRYLDFCYTALCWGALNIRLMKPLDNHYYAFPCQACNTADAINYFYLLPVRVRQICYEEGKEYTRAKCNRCASCIVVYFDTLPDKFINLKHPLHSQLNRLHV